MKTILLFLLLVQTVYTSPIPDLREEKVDLGKGVVLEMVNVKNRLWVGKYEVTQGQYIAVMGDPGPRDIAGYLHDPRLRGDKKAMDCISLEAALNFCKKACEKTGHVIRLPTEEEWDFFSNGTVFEGAICSIGANKDRVQPCEVGTGKPNRFGLFDIRGNVMEICSGTWKKSGKPILSNGHGPWAPVRGGCYWFNSKKMMELDFKDWAMSKDAIGQAGVGFRCVMDK